MRCPAIWGSTLTVLALSALLSLTVAGPTALVLLLGAWTAASHPTLQHRLDRVAARRARQRARDDREQRLEDARIGWGELSLLTELVDAIERCDPSYSETGELEQLLDRYVAVAISAERYRTVLRASEVWRLEIGARSTTRRGTIAMRRLAHWRRCHARWQQLDDELVAIAALLATLAERAAMRLSDTLVPARSE